MAVFLVKFAVNNFRRTSTVSTIFAPPVAGAALLFPPNIFRLTSRLPIDLSHAVDVYSEWVDACDEVANPKEKTTGRSSGAIRASQQLRGRYDGGEEDDDLGGGYGANERSRLAAPGHEDDDDLDED